MALALLFTVVALMFIGAIASLAFVGLAAGAAAGAGVVALAVAALLFPFLFVILIFGLIRAGLCPARSLSYRRDWRGPRMSDEWHRTPQGPDAAGKGAS